MEARLHKLIKYIFREIIDSNYIYTLSH